MGLNPYSKDPISLPYTPPFTATPARNLVKLGFSLLLGPELLGILYKVPPYKTYLFANSILFS